MTTDHTPPDTTPPAPEMLPPLLTPEQTAALLQLDLTELSTHRQHGTGPEYHRIGNGAIRYSTTAVTAWRHRSPTPPPPEGPRP